MELQALLTLILLTFLPALTAGLSESKPLRLRDLKVFTANENSSAVSYIDFIFHDHNKGLKLKTLCRRFVFPGEGSLIDGNYYACANDSVAFMYGGTRMDVQRSYIDPSVGPPGWDVVTGFGHAKTKFTKTADEGCGTMQKQKLMQVQITSLIAKQ